MKVKYAEPKGYLSKDMEKAFREATKSQKAKTGGKKPKKTAK